MMGNFSKKLSENLENNIKNKSTAMYYLIAKKLIREGYKIKSFFNSPEFDVNALIPIEDTLIT